ncbi:hypothetical protein PROFUN_09857 [Planoprotostelium fungivorum]|uniref:LIM zinc-binding domain-containing protein n=1 Tax=Planoprotostelium fungivorum TaxID=1890364 RepID=A0A2P6NFR4_9EUKA|nr:hypothetical protein PROFUN_09857 [Planoprotostelium fungivorum]
MSDLDDLIGSLQSDLQKSGSGPTQEGKSCPVCTRVVLGRRVDALGDSYHEECFKCNTCAKILGTTEFYHEGKTPFCDECFRTSRLTKCADCDEWITGKYLEAMNQKYHPEHFRCVTCKGGFVDNSFFPKNNRAYCAKCINSA